MSSISTEIEPKPESGRLVNIDALRVFAIMLVIGIHEVAPWISQFPLIAPGAWWFMDAIESIARPSVPLFFMVSGLLLLKKNNTSETTGVFFRKRFIKVIIPFIFWSIVYLIWRQLIQGDVKSAINGLAMLLHGPVYYHLWFVYTLLGLYLATPILREYVQYASRQNLRYFLGLWGVWIILNFLNNVGFTIAVEIPLVAGYVGYFLLGHYLSSVQVPRNRLKFVYILIVVIWAINLLGTYWRSSDTNQYSGLFLDYFSPSTLLLAISIFFVFNTLAVLNFSKNPQLRSSVIRLSEMSYGIYLLHPFILDILTSQRLGIRLTDPTHITPLIGLPLTCLITFLICVGIVRIVRWSVIGKLLPIL